MVGGAIRRLRLAAALLRNCDGEAGPFGRQFKDITGESPGEVRARAQAQKELALAGVPACIVSAIERPQLTISVLEKRRRAPGGTKGHRKSKEAK